MSALEHEIWMDPEGLESCILAGTEGNSTRKLMPEGSKCIHTFWAKSTFEAMTYYNNFLGHEPYSIDHPEDFEEYDSVTCN